MEKMRKLLNSRLGVLMGVATGLLFLAVVAVSHAAIEPQDKGKGGESSLPSNCASRWCPKSNVSTNAFRSKSRRRMPLRQPVIALRSIALRPRKKSKSEARQARGHPHDAGLTCGQCLSPKRQHVDRESVAHPAFC